MHSKTLEEFRGDARRIHVSAAAIAFVTLAVMSREFRLKLRDVNDIEGRRKAFYSKS